MSLLRMYIKVRSLGTSCATRWLTNAQVEVAHETLNELGELGVLEFKDVRGRAAICVLKNVFGSSLTRIDVFANVTRSSLRLLSLALAHICRQLKSHVGGFQRTFANDIKRCDEMERRVGLSASCTVTEDLTQNPAQVPGGAGEDRGHSGRSGAAL